MPAPSPSHSPFHFSVVLFVWGWAGRGSGPAHQHKLWAGALCSWPSRADARVLECNAITGAGCWGGAQQESAWPPFPVSLGPWPMCGGNRGQAHTRQAQQQQPARMAAFGRVGFSGSVSDLNSKRGKSTCLKRARDFVPAFRLHFSHWGAPSTCNPPSHPGR